MPLLRPRVLEPIQVALWIPLFSNHVLQMRALLIDREDGKDYPPLTMKIVGTPYTVIL